MTPAFRVVGLLEGVSFLMLLGLAMPLKYVYGITSATQIPGLAHGVLFMLYVLLAIRVSADENWPRRKLAFAFAASVLPLGTFIFDRFFLSRSSPSREA